MKIMYGQFSSHLQRLNCLNNFYFDEADYYFGYCPSSQLQTLVKVQKIYLHLQVQEI